jgi:hypothetical protein
LALVQGDYGRIEALLGESLRLGGEVGARDVLAEVLEVLACAAVACGQPQRAARLGGAAETLREALGARLPPVLEAHCDRLLQDARLALGSQAFAAAWVAGQAFPLADALAEALSL